jgi:Chain length determinant protein
MTEPAGSKAMEIQPAGGRPIPVPQPGAAGASGSYGYGHYGNGYGYGSSDDTGIRTKVFTYWRIIYKRKWLIAAIVTACVAFGALTTLMKTPLYTSSVRLQIDRAGTKVFKGGDVSAASEDDYSGEFMRTQFELLLSGAIAERVASARTPTSSSRGRSR